MQIYKNLINNRIALSNIRYADKTNKANLIFVPEEGSNGLVSFLSKQIRSLYGEITVPGIISNFVGKKLSSQPYYLGIKKELPNYIYNRLPNSKEQSSTNTSKIFDTSAIIGPILNITKNRSKKLVFSELIKLFDSVVKDYGTEDNILFIYADEASSDNPVFLQFLKYIMNLTGGKFQTKLTAIVYMFNNKHYPLAIQAKKPDGKLHFIRNNVELVLKNMEKQKHGEDEYSSIEDIDIEKRTKRREVKEKINELSKQLESDKDDTKKVISEIKELVHSTIKNNKSFQEKLEDIYNDVHEEDKSKVNGETTPIDKISKTLQDLNEKYNGNITVDLKSNDPIDPEVIVGMKHLGNYNKQEQELNENMDENIKDLIESTLVQDKELNLELLSIKTKVVDNYNNRYKEYTARIKHKVGNTTDKPYNITFRTPIVVQGKYTKIGGNNYIMINQLFSAPISKISPVLARFYSHFGVTSLELKNTRLTANKDFEEVEEKFITEMKSVDMIKQDDLKVFDNKRKDEIVDKYNLGDIHSFKYSKITINI